jgi:hypothetical protein
LLAEIKYRTKSAEGKVRHPLFKRHPRKLMNWGHVIRNTAIAIGITFVTTIGVYVARRFFRRGYRRFRSQHAGDKIEVWLKAPR